MEMHNSVSGKAFLGDSAYGRFYDALKSGDLEDAERTVSEQLAVSLPASAFWLTQRAHLFFRTGQFSQALIFFDKALQAEPNCVEALLGAVVVLSDLGFYEEAAKRFEVAQSLEMPSDLSTAIPRSLQGEVALCYAQIARLYSDLGFDDRAIQESQSALRMTDTFALRYQLAQNFVKLDQYDRAYEQLYPIQHDSQAVHADLLLLLLQCCLKLKKYSQARELFVRLRSANVSLSALTVFEGFLQKEDDQ